MPSCSSSKASLRKFALAELQNTTQDTFVAAGIMIKDSLAIWLAQHSSKPRLKFGCFANFKDEIDTAPLNELLLNLGHERYFPATTTSGTLKFFDDQHAPIELDRLDIILVPGLAFGVDGARLGRGLGCYDRFLAPITTLAQKPLLVALCLDCQVKEHIPIEAHDVCMDYLCTPGLGMYKIKKRGQL